MATLHREASGDKTIIKIAGAQQHNKDHNKQHY